MIKRISILIICKDFSKIQMVLDDVLALEHESIEWEVLAGEGDNPSEQRNFLAHKASGDWLLFLDDDSRPARNLLMVYKNFLEKNDVLLAGGPSLVGKSPSAVGKLSQIFFSSMWGIGPYLSRYNSIGSARVSNERELILCNMIFHKEFFLKQGGFCRDLYPNEENEFIKRVDSNRHIFYIPDAVVERPARASAWAFALQLFGYGKGRFKNIYLKKNFGDYIFVAPAFFSLYLIAGPFLIFRHQWALMLPMLIYFLLTSYAGILRLRDFGVLVFLAPLFFILGHFSYGLGVWRGFFEYAIFQKDTKLQPASFINVHQLK